MAEFYTEDEVVNKFGVSKYKIYELAASGKLQPFSGFHLGFRFQKTQVDELFGSVSVEDKPVFSKTEYMKLHGTICPYCGSTLIHDISYLFHSGGFSKISVEFVCEKCAKEWESVYQMLTVLTPSPAKGEK